MHAAPLIHQARAMFAIVQAENGEPTEDEPHRCGFISADHLEEVDFEHAQPATRVAVKWLRDHGYARLSRDADGEVVEFLLPIGELQ